MKLAVQGGTTDLSLVIFAQDSSQTDGRGLTGLVYDTSNLKCYYCRPGAVATEINLATQTVTGAHADGGFVEISSTNMPGAYRLDLPDAVIAAGAPSVVVILGGALNLAPVVLEIQLDPVPADAVEISGDSAAADALETMLDGTGGNVLKLKQLLIVAEDNDSAIDVTGKGTGCGIKAKGGDAVTGSPDGILAEGGDNQGDGFRANGPDGYGWKAQGASTKAGVYALGSGTGPGFYALAATNANGFTAEGQGSGHGIEAIKGASGKDIAADIEGNLSGSVGSVTALSAAAVQSIWDALTSALTTVGSIGKKLADWTIGTAQTGDSFARLGAPAGASVSADVAAAKAIADAIKAITDNLPNSGALSDLATILSRTLPAATVAKLVLALGASPSGAATADTLSTTQMSTDLTEPSNDHYKNRIILWASGALDGQGARITDYDGPSKTLTFTAVTEAPSEGDTFIIL